MVGEYYEQPRKGRLLTAEEVTEFFSSLPDNGQYSPTEPLLQHILKAEEVIEEKEEL